METELDFNLLDKNTEELLRISKACNHGQLNHKTEGRWSILEILEHVLATEKVVYFLLQRPSEKRSQQLSNFGQQKLSRIMIDLRGRKIVAPENLHPKGLIKDVASFEKALFEGRETLKNKIITGEIKIDNSTHKHPILGEMTKRDWFDFIPLHAQRHLEQIKDMIAEFSPPRH